MLRKIESNEAIRILEGMPRRRTRRGYINVEATWLIRNIMPGLLTSAARRILEIMGGYVNTQWSNLIYVSQRRISRESGCSVKTVRRCIQCLVLLGYLIEVGTHKVGCHVPKKYFLNRDKLMASQYVANSEYTGYLSRDMLSPDQGTFDPPNNYIITIKQQQEVKIPVPPQTPFAAAAFPKEIAIGDLLGKSLYGDRSPLGDILKEPHADVETYDQAIQSHEDRPECSVTAIDSFLDDKCKKVMESIRENPKKPVDKELRLMRRKEIETILSENVSPKLDGRVPLSDLYLFTRQYGIDRVLKASSVLVQRDLSSIKKPSAYLAKALREDWSLGENAMGVHKSDDYRTSVGYRTEKEGTLHHKSYEPVYYSDQENAVWWASWSDEDRAKAIEHALKKQPFFEKQLDALSVRPGDSDFSTEASKRWAFNLLMELIGRRKPS